MYTIYSLPVFGKIIIFKKVSYQKISRWTENFKCMKAEQMYYYFVS